MCYAARPVDLLLTHGYFLAEDPVEQAVMKPYPPLGLLYLSSHLRAKGFAVEIHDSTFSTFDALADRLAATPPSTLGVYSTLLTRPAAVRIIRRAKALGWRVIAGGPEPSNYAQEYLDAGADLVVEGEGEIELRTPPLKLSAELYSTNIVVRERDYGPIVAAQVGPSFHVRHPVFAPVGFGVFHEPGEWIVRSGANDKVKASDAVR